eukprot:CFRG0688T1
MDLPDSYFYDDQIALPKRKYGVQPYTTASQGNEVHLSLEAEASMRVAPLRQIFLRKIYANNLVFLATHVGKGIFAHPSTEYDRLWHGIVFPHEGPYKGGLFRFDIIIPEKYPHEIPTVQFRTFLFHPQVSLEDGSIDEMIKRALPEWNSKSTNMISILNVVLEIFTVQSLHDGDKCPNQAAYNMYATSSESFYEEVAGCIEQSRAEVFDRQLKGNVLEFSEYDEIKHGKARENIHLLKYDDFETPNLFSDLKSSLSVLFQRR